jgi:hypothetical protein
MADLITTLKQVKVGDFVKFTDKDKSGKFNYVGEVLSIEQGWINILAFEGEMGFKIDKDNHLETILTQPTGWKKYKDDPEGYRLKINNEKLKARQKEQKAHEIEAASMKTVKEKVKEFVLSQKERTLEKLLKKVSKEFKDTDQKLLTTYIQLALLKI